LRPPFRMETREGVDASSQETLLQPSLALLNHDSSPSPFSSWEAADSVVRRKPVLPRRSSHLSLEERSYDVIEMEDTDGSPRPDLPPRSLGPPQRDSHNTYEEDLKHNEWISGGVLPPKAFRKTRRFLNMNFGYWRQPARHFSVFTAITLAVVLPLVYLSGGFSYLGADEGTQPFQFDCYGTSEGWTFIGLNWRFGTMNYGSAKALDLAWNWIVGRGLQGILSIITYSVFSDALLRAAETTPLSYGLFASISFYSMKPTMMWHLGQGLAKQGNWRTKFILFWLLISTIYLLAFPRLVPTSKLSICLNI